MRVFTPDETAARLPYDRLVAGLDRVLAGGLAAPDRHHHTMPRSGEADAVLLLMPCWQGAEGYGGVKIVNVTPGNAARGLPAIAASYLVFDERTGSHLALLDGGTLTARRTAAVSALAASKLARPESSRLLVVGAGRVASELPHAYRAGLPITRVDVWNKTAANAERLVARLVAEGIDAHLCADLEAGVASADVVACATLAAEPVVKGAWLRPGQHVDLIGAFTPAMREVDDAAIAKAAIWVDTRTALTEAGELILPIRAGVITAGDVRGTLPELCAHGAPARADGAITLFKSVGSAAEDLAAAIVALEGGI